LMWVVIAIEVPVYLVWLVQLGQQLPHGDVARRAPAVLLLPTAVAEWLAAELCRVELSRRRCSGWWAGRSRTSRPGSAAAGWSGSRTRRARAWRACWRR
jgi:hypothetical protein